MIIEMSKVRILGPRDRLPDTLRSIQQIGVLHLAAPAVPQPLVHLQLSAREQRERRHLLAALENVGAALTQLKVAPPTPVRNTPVAPSSGDLARWARLGWRVRRAAERLKVRTAKLEEERALILKYQGFFAAFRPLLENEHRWPNASVYHVLLKRGQADAIQRLRTSLTAVIGDAFEIYHRELPTGEIALLAVVSAQVAGRVDRLLAEAHVQEVPVPVGYGTGSLGDVIPRMVDRLADLPAELEATRKERQALARAHGGELGQAQAGIVSRLAALDALLLSGVTTRAFVMEGWAPAESRPRLEAQLRTDVGDSVVVSEISREEWKSEEAPVVLKNPRILRPFEAVIGLLPLPRYGTIDPTPFVAVFFPAFFGLMLGDIGYGLLLAAGGLLLHWRSKPDTMLRSVSEIIGPCALFSIIAGVMFGEFFGDLGRHWFGLRALAFDRGEALIPFLLLSVGIGAVHILLGLVLGVIAARGQPREMVGRGASLVAIVLIIVALLTAVNVLPHGFFTPAVVGLLIAFPVLIIAEGIVAPIELLSTVGNILSYARIMALGVASVMLAVVANRMVGAMGGAVVGVVFGLLFHLVNFAIGLFSPTIHALRLHYVEFFGKFYSPGGVRYQPFGAWAHPAGSIRS